MPPCLDIYVWAPEMERDSWATFLGRYVNDVQDGEPRWPAFYRKHVEQVGYSADDGEVDELRWEEGGSTTIYLRGIEHHGASITATRDGAFILGVSLDDPLGERDIEDARDVLADLLRTTGGTDGMIGVELPPPADRSQWDHEEPMERRPAGTDGVL